MTRKEQPLTWGFMQAGLDGSAIVIFAKPGIDSGWTNNAGL